MSIPNAAVGAMLLAADYGELERRTLAHYGIDGDVMAMRIGDTLSCIGRSHCGRSRYFDPEPRKPSGHDRSKTKAARKANKRRRMK